MKTLKLSLLFLLAVVTNATAQTQNANPASVQSAKMDVQQFKLDHELWKQFKEHRFGSSSDYFKPGKANASDINNLNDSVYVKAFRNYAYQKTLHRRTAGHYILIFGGIGLLIAATILAILIAHGLEQI